MPEYKKQHFIPQFYLKNFAADKKEHILLLNKTFSQPRTVSIKDQCRKDYFYSGNPIVEKAISVLEGKFSEIVNKIISNQNLIGLTKDEQLFLNFFIVNLKSRTDVSGNTFQESAELIFKNFFVPYAKSKAEQEGLKNLNFEDVTIKINNAAAQSMAMSFYTEVLLSDLETTLLLNRSNINFLTSDNPVILFNPAFDKVTNFGTRGLAQEGLQILVPIAPQLTILLYDPVYYQISRNKNKVTYIKQESEVNQINCMQALNSDNNLYSNYFGEVKDLLLKMNMPKQEMYTELYSKEINSNQLKEIWRINQNKVPYEFNPKFLRAVYRADHKPRIRSIELYDLCNELRKDIDSKDRVKNRR